MQTARENRIASLPGASKESIGAHYDRSDSFFRLFLGETMCYSGALFADAATLDDAQRAKVDYHLKASGLQAGGRLLDIGCGWGTLLFRALQVWGATEAVGVTLSESQAAHIRKSNAHGLTVSVQHWRDHEPHERYDSIVSIGALEHFVDANCSEEERLVAYDAFFAKVRGWIKPTGGVSIQCIAHGRDSASPHFLSQDGTFAESALPYCWELIRASRAYFELRLVVCTREDYIKTLDSWLVALKARSAEAIELVGSEPYTSFLRYLRVARAGFLFGTTELVRMTLIPRTER